MYMRFWKDCDCDQTHGRLREWTIFVKRPSDDVIDWYNGAVLYNIDWYGRCAILDGIRTEPTAHDEQVEVMYVMEGTGLARVADEEFPLREGTSFRIPAGAVHTLSNTGTTGLVFISMRRRPYNDGTEDTCVWGNYREDRPPEMIEQYGDNPYQGHWNHIYSGPDAAIHTGEILPRNISDSHSHGPFTDEIWYTQYGNAWHWEGKRLMPQPAGYAMWIVPDHVHTYMNPSDESVRYVYIGCSRTPLME